MYKRRIYIGNLPYTSIETDVRELFEKHGTVHSINMVMDRDTGKSRGFAFVEMDEEQANTAIEALNGTDFGGRTLRVNEARPKKTRGPRRGEHEDVQPEG